MCFECDSFPEMTVASYQMRRKKENEKKIKPWNLLKEQQWALVARSYNVRDERNSEMRVFSSYIQ
jgi:hypothetical protein